MTTDTYLLQLDEKEVQLFEKWLLEREESLSAQLQQVKVLRSKLRPARKPEPEPVHTPVERKPRAAVRHSSISTRHQSWTSRILHVFSLLRKNLTSKEIVDWFIINDETVRGKDRTFVSKSVTSKLAVLEAKGILKKEVVGNKHVYNLTREEATAD